MRYFNFKDMLYLKWCEE